MSWGVDWRWRAARTPAAAGAIVRRRRRLTDDDDEPWEPAPRRRRLLAPPSGGGGEWVRPTSFDDLMNWNGEVGAIDDADVGDPGHDGDSTTCSTMFGPGPCEVMFPAPAGSPTLATIYVAIKKTPTDTVITLKVNPLVNGTPTGEQTAGEVTTSYPTQEDGSDWLSVSIALTPPTTSFGATLDFTSEGFGEITTLYLTAIKVHYT